MPEEKQQSFPAPPKTLPRVKKGLTHYTDFLRACKEGGTPPCSNFDYGGALTQVGLLGLVALRFPGQTLKWDGQAGRFTNHPVANSLVQIPFRSGWKL